MPETRYHEEYNYPKDLPAVEKTVGNAEKHGWINRIPYEVSDEELAREAEPVEAGLEEEEEVG